MTAHPHKPRILFPFIGGKIVGGSHVSALKMIRALDRTRFDPLIALHRPHAQGQEGTATAGALGRYVHELGLTFTLLDNMPYLATGSTAARAALPYVLRSLPRMIRFLRRERIDIVHSNDGRMHASWALPARLAGCRLVWHHRQGPEARGVNLLAPLLADRILSVSRFSQPSNPIRPVAHKTTILRSPFELTLPRPDPVQARRTLCATLGVPEHSLLLGYFGLLTPRKRPVHFVEVIARLREAFPDRPVHGLIYGRDEGADGTLTEACHHRARALGLTEQLHLMGHHAPIEPHMAGVDALLVTALREPFGRTLIEAMHLGTPVIATNHGGNPEAIRHQVTGFLVDPDRPEAFVAPLRALATDPALRKRIILAAQQDVQARFGMPRHLSEITAVYDSLQASGERAEVLT